MARARATETEDLKPDTEATAPAPRTATDMMVAEAAPGAVTWSAEAAPVELQAAAADPDGHYKPRWLTLIADGSEHATIHPTHVKPTRPLFLADPPRGCHRFDTHRVEGGWLHVYSEIPA